MASCLAGPRKKQRITPNPRGNSWSNDSNKYGQKLMEKMGWSEGKGLGAEEHGNTEHVKVTRKNDSAGMGYSGCPDTWTAHHDDFNSILAGLNESNTTGETIQPGEATHTAEDGQIGEATVMSLAEKSKKSRSRVHYGKFTKSKDLSTKSQADLDCVFGKRKIAKSSREPSPLSSQMDDQIEEDARFVRSDDSVAAYFAKKMKKVKNTEHRDTRLNEARDTGAESADNDHIEISSCDVISGDIDEVKGHCNGVSGRDIATGEVNGLGIEDDAEMCSKNIAYDENSTGKSDTEVRSRKRKNNQLNGKAKHTHDNHQCEKESTRTNTKNTKNTKNNIECETVDSCGLKRVKKKRKKKKTKCLDDIAKF